MLFTYLDTLEHHFSKCIIAEYSSSKSASEMITDLPGFWSFLIEARTFHYKSKVCDDLFAI